MTSYGLDEWFWAMFEPTWTLPNFTFGRLFMWIRANNDQVWLPMSWMSDSEQCSNRLGTWLNFTFGQLFMWIMANNDQMGLSMGLMSDSEQCSNWLELISLLANFSYELGKIGGSFEKKVRSGDNNVISQVLYCFELRRKMFFAIQKANLVHVDIQSSFVFKRTQSRLVLINFWIGADRWIFWEKSPKCG